MVSPTMDHTMSATPEMLEPSAKPGLVVVPKSPATPDSMPDINIIDIRRDGIEVDLKKEILSSLKPKHGPKTMPTLLLYDERGLQIFEKITYLEEYYLTNAEIDVLTSSAKEIARNIPSQSMVVELGSGNLRKVSILLKALEEAAKDIDYYALDLSVKELERTLADVPRFQHVRCHGLHGTYDDGLAWLKAGRNAFRPKVIMTLGSSIGNFHRGDAAAFLKDFADILGPNDIMLVGLDACYDAQKVYHAYNDKENVTHQFVLNGLRNANRILGEKVFKIDDWKVIGEFVVDHEGGRHQAFYVPKKDLTVLGVRIEAGERVQVEQSLKYSPEESEKLWSDSGLQPVGKWAASTEPYHIHMLSKKAPPFHLSPEKYAASTTPTLDEWMGLWALWDTVTRGMIPDEELGNKPIKLRNACIFYLGHIPTFLDMKLVETTGEALCEPTYFPTIFERGIDPDVDNPEHCHAHSEIPDEWPQLEEILAHQTQVRNKVVEYYDNEEIDRKLGRTLWLGFEHEVMHLETLLYMLLQSDKTLAPPRTMRPDFESDARRAANVAVPNEWFTVPEQEITIGLDDLEDNSGDGHYGWDVEKPSRKTKVASFQAKGRAITNEDYAIYLQATSNNKLPASWKTLPNNIASYTPSTKLNQAYLADKSVLTVYGAVPLSQALHWPVFASYDELSACAAYYGGRIPTAPEAQSIYAHVSQLKEAEQQLSQRVPAVNGHLSANGVQETPPPSTITQDEKLQQKLFVDLTACNVGFQNWHPVSISHAGNRLNGQGEMGGVWEWTATPLARHEGYEPMPLYPAYSSDFFDGKHNVVLGGSWATHPRVAGRKSFVNWYQRNYPYAWCGARIVRDI